MINCKQCGKELLSDEIAIYKRLVHRGAEEFLCIPCLAAHFHVSEQLVYEKIEHFKKQGCTLFEKDNTVQ